MGVFFSPFQSKAFQIKASLSTFKHIQKWCTERDNGKMHSFQRNGFFTVFYSSRCFNAGKTLGNNLCSDGNAFMTLFDEKCAFMDYDGVKFPGNRDVIS